MYASSNGEPHPALVAALRSLRNNRSPRNAYILMLGLTGSGKSSTVSVNSTNSSDFNLISICLHDTGFQLQRSRNVEATKNLTIVPTAIENLKSRYA